MRPVLVFAAFLAPLGVLACGGGAPPAESVDTATPADLAPAEPPAPADFSEQVTRGQEVYRAKCAGCHGDAGEGKPGGGPPVVGLDKGALPLKPASGSKRTTEFKTVADIAEYVVKTMPPNAPGSLSAEDYYSVLAFDLKANGIDLGDKKLDGELAKTLEVPRK
jgi:S-disulfanyl-L-cysteine oxidoreductase SoxD